MTVFDQNVITNTVSTFISSQLPEFIRDGSPAFVQFMQAYYEFLETADFGPNSNSVIYNSKNLLDYKDVDATSNAFIQYFINDFLPYFPNDVALDERKLIKVARNFYTQKGTPQSIQFLFQVLYNKHADIYFPKDNILKCSDGKWTLPQALRLLLSANNLNFPVQDLVGAIGVGSNSGAQCVIESVDKVVDPNLGFEIVEVYVSQITKPFSDLEDLVIKYNVPQGDPIFQEKIIAALSGVVIDPHNRGLTYNVGDPVVLTGGLEPNDPQAQKGVAFVGNVTTGSVASVNVVFGGYDYREDPNTIVTFVNQHGSNGVGAKAIVTGIDVANAVYKEVNIDCLEFHQNVVIGSAGSANQWGFTNCAFTNANTPMYLALTFANLQFAPITSMEITAGGGGYSKVPSVAMEVVYYTDLTNALELAHDPSAPSTFQNIDDLGVFAAVQVLFGGTNYSNVTDAIYTNTAIGYDATFDFTTDANGAISKVIITDPGCGYIGLPNIGLYFANSANAQLPANGSGAALQAYGFGQGAVVTVGVNQIGQIIDFDLVNRGFDYIAAPVVSLRIQDVTINALGVNQVPEPDAVIYQGANANSGIYSAFVDSLSANNVLRLYNYKGALNVYQNLIMTLTTNLQVNVSVNNDPPVITYGNGLAKANAVFLNGLIQYPGFYLTTDGFLSWDQYLQDANTYHNYSYQIIVEKALADYKKVLMQLAHPAGMSMLGIYVVSAPESIGPAFSSNVSYISPLTGNVTPNTHTANLVGHGTAFLTEGAAPGEIIVFNTSDSSRLLQAKVITAVVSNTALNLESNTMFAFANLVSVSNGSNTINTTGDFIGVIGLGDTVLLNVAGNVIYSNVESEGAGSLNVNTVFNANATSLMMAVLPNIVNASYMIVSANAL